MSAPKKKPAAQRIAPRPRCPRCARFVLLLETLREVEDKTSLTPRLALRVRRAIEQAEVA